MKLPKIKTDPFVRSHEKTTGTIVEVLYGLAFIRLLPFGHNLRDVLPEPIDIMDHVSNLVLSISIAYFLTLVIAKGLYALKIKSVQALFVARAVALPVIIGINALFETQAGTQIVGTTSTPDIIDLAYGSVGAIFGVLMLGWPSGRRK